MAHARLSPSSMYRILACAGSLALSEKAPPKPSSPDAELGTAAHELAEACLRLGKEPEDYIGMTFNNHIVDAEMADYVSLYTDALRMTFEICESDYHAIEARLDFSKAIGVPDQFGTADCIIIRDGELQLHDLKYGMGRVSAKWNDQLLTYAKAAVDTFEFVHGPFRNIRLVIHQPRLGVIDEFELTPPELEQWFVTAKNKTAFAVELADTPGAQPELWLTPGEKQCRFCPAKLTCPALKTFCADQMYRGLENLDQAELDLAALGEAMKHVDLLEDYTRSIRKAVTDSLMRGKHVPGWKLVAGRKGARDWTDDSMAELTMQTLGLPNDVIYTKKLVSPAQAEKALKTEPKTWDVIQTLITQRDGKPHVTQADDPRPALVLTPAESGFGDLEAEN